MNQKKIYTINENNPIVKEGKTAFYQLSTIILDAVYGGILAIIFSYINAIIISIDLGLLFINIFILFTIISALINIYLSTKKYYRYSLYKSINYILVDGNQYALITNLNKINTNSTITPLDLSANNLNNNKQNQYNDDEIMIKIKNNEIKNYFIRFFKNVKFQKETKYSYYFIGDLVQKNNKIIKNKQFKIQKIYNNYEELKVIQ